VASNGIKIGARSSIFGGPRGIKSAIAKGSVVSSLVETNRILVEIQKQLALDFATRVAQQEFNNRQEKDNLSRERFGKEERESEKKRKKIAKVIKEKSRAIVEPIKDVFDRIKKFLLTLGAGFLANNIFKWLGDPENRKKVTGWFNFVTENWKWILAAVALFNSTRIGFTILGAVTNILKAIGLIKTVLGILFSPLVLKVLGVVALAAGAFLTAKKIYELLQGDPLARAAEKRAKEKLFREGVKVTDLGQAMVFVDKDGNPIKLPESALENFNRGELFSSWANTMFGDGHGNREVLLEDSGTEEQKKSYKRYQELINRIKELERQKDEEMKAAGDNVQLKNRIEAIYAEKFIDLIPSESGKPRLYLPYNFSDFPDYSQIYNDPRMDNFNYKNMFNQNGNKVEQVSSLMDFAEGADSIQIVNLAPQETTTERNSVANVSEMKSVNISSSDRSNPYIIIAPEILGISMVS
jgi:hypothetical protein